MFYYYYFYYFYYLLPPDQAASVKVLKPMFVVCVFRAGSVCQATDPKVHAIWTVCWRAGRLPGQTGGQEVLTHGKILSF